MATSPGPSATRYRWAAAGDVNAFFGLMLDNVMNLVILAGILIFVFGFPEDLVYRRMFPGTALGVMFGDLVYTWMAFRLAKKEGRSDVTAMPLGLDAPSTIGMAFTVLGPAYLAAKARMPEHEAAISAWQVGMACMILIGLFKVGMSFVGGAIQRTMPGAGLLDTVITAEHLHDVGKFLFAFTAFWAYIAFSQFFLMWYANLPEETIWYKARLEGSWKAISILLMAGHFGVPFFYLMGRAVKRRGWTLAVGGAWLLAMHFVDLYWQVMPTLHPDGVRPAVLDLAAFVAIGGCFVAAASWLMRRQALVPLGDPRLAESLAFENA